MERILMSATEVTKSIGVTPSRFFRWQDAGLIAPVTRGGKVYYDLREARELNSRIKGQEGRLRPPEYPADKFANVPQALNILQICRKTFYDRVAKGKIKLHKYETRSFVRLSDISPEKVIFVDNDYLL